MKNQRYAKLLNMARINGSNLGNPNYSVMLETYDSDGKPVTEVLRSSSNCSWCYGISGDWIGKSIAYTTTRSNRINYMKKLEITDTFSDPLLTLR